MAERRRDRAGIGFLIVWIVFWTAAILIAAWRLGGAAGQGDASAAVVLAIWLAAAGFGLWNAARRLKQLLTNAPPKSRPNARHRWEGGIDRTPDA